MSRIGIVTIGRNEGQRLRQCLESVLGKAEVVVYVDSGSVDDSVEMARSLGVTVVELDLSIPFTAARARNAGFQELVKNHPGIEYVQFVDGDCEVVQGWIEAAAATLDANSNAVAVCGWRRERYPEQSMLNRVCDVEWRMGSVGEITHFGGDVMIRASALAAVGGYNDTVIAAEDDELSVRLLQNGGTMLRIDQVSTLHDANMHHLSEWWNRGRRGGYAYALVHSLHGASPQQKFVREVRRTWLWGVFVPLISLGLAPVTYGWSLLIFLRYPLTALKTMYSKQKSGFSWADSVAWGLSCGFVVFPEAIGAIKFALNRLSNKQHEIIEYKGPQPSV